jgi:hypothetical protein
MTTGGVAQVIGLASLMPWVQTQYCPNKRRKKKWLPRPGYEYGEYTMGIYIVIIIKSYQKQLIYSFVNINYRKYFT